MLLRIDRLNILLPLLRGDDDYSGGFLVGGSLLEVADRVRHYFLGGGATGAPKDIFWRRFFLEIGDGSRLINWLIVALEHICAFIAGG